MDVANEVMEEALRALPDAGVVLNFSCAARAVLFGANTPEEARRLQNTSGNITTFGFYCCGEFARTAGVLGTHNATLTAIAL